MNKIFDLFLRLVEKAYLAKLENVKQMYQMEVIPTNDIKVTDQAKSTKPVTGMKILHANS
jgi:hypothetical protein